MNSIGKITIQFHMEEAAFARALYSRWETFFYTCIEKVLDRVLSKHCPETPIPEIKELVLDLGGIPEDRLEQYYPELLEEKLTLAFKPYLPIGQAVADDTQTNEDYLLEILCLYLLHGRLPWHIYLTYPTISRLFLAVLQIAAAGLKTFLLTYGHYTGLQQRLVIQLDDPALESGIRLMAPHESTFICSYIHLLQEKYKTARPEISKEKYRDITWQLIYQYLLTNRSSYFNKKSFIYTTLSHLAKEYNTGYKALLVLLTNPITQMDTIRSTPVELFMILNELREDIEIQHQADLMAGKLEWKDKNEIIHLVKERKRPPLSYLKKILGGEKNASFRQQLCEALAETDHHFLIRLLEPSNSRFILAYARGLDRQKEAGTLQGKAGSNYQALKWNFIYDVLLLSRHQVFNKKQFVQRTLAGIAAHYNVDIYLLLSYFHDEILLTDSTLPFDVIQAIRQLYTESTGKQKSSISRPVKPNYSQPGNSRTDASRASQLLKKYIPVHPVYNHLVNKLNEHPSFICWLEPFLQTASILSQYLWDTYHIKPQYHPLLQWLVSVIDKGQAISLNIMVRLLVRYYSSMLAEEEQVSFRQAIRQFAITHPLLANYPAEDIKVKEQTPATLPVPAPLQTYIGNAGLVLISPFLPLLFSRLELTGTNGFQSEAEQVKAIYLLQYLVWGHTGFPEYEMELNRLLTSYPTPSVIGRCPELLPHEETTANSMLQGVLQNWKKLKGTSIAGLREGFLQREGSLEEKEDSYLLYVEAKGYDILLDTIPWNFRTINYSWMEKPLFINWR